MRSAIPLLESSAVHACGRLKCLKKGGRLRLGEEKISAFEGWPKRDAGVALGDGGGTAGELGVMNGAHNVLATDMAIEAVLVRFGEARAASS